MLFHITHKYLHRRPRHGARLRFFIFCVALFYIWHKHDQFKNIALILFINMAKKYVAENYSNE